MHHLVAFIIAFGIFIGDSPAEAHHKCNHACRVQKHKKRYIRPYHDFLASTGACESGTDHNLRHGLTAVSPSGQYRGRYQFGVPDWHRAGGWGDPIEADWLEQAYRAVKWLKINGRQSWPNC